MCRVHRAEFVNDILIDSRIFYSCDKHDMFACTCNLAVCR